MATLVPAMPRRLPRPPTEDREIKEAKPETVMVVDQDVVAVAAAATIVVDKTFPTTLVHKVVPVLRLRRTTKPHQHPKLLVEALLILPRNSLHQSLDLTAARHLTKSEKPAPFPPIRLNAVPAATPLIPATDLDAADATGPTATGRRVAVTDEADRTSGESRQSHATRNTRAQRWRPGMRRRQVASSSRA